MIGKHTPGVDAGHGSIGRGRTGEPRLPAILAYHAITRAEEDPNRICVSPQRFEAQMLYIKRRGLRGVSVQELLRATGAGNNAGLVGITFDDAYENFLDFAVPILEKCGFSATVFAVGGMLGSSNFWDESPRMKLLGEEGLREAARRGMEIGAHSMSHIRLAGLPAAQLAEEVGESRRVLEEVLDEPVEGFCYPYGSLDVAAAQATRGAGYSYACACWIRAESNVYDLPRPPVWEFDGPLMLAAKLKLFPRYFEVTGSSTRNAVEDLGMLAYRGTKSITRTLSTK